MIRKQFRGGRVSIRLATAILAGTAAAGIGAITAFASAGAHNGPEVKASGPAGAEALTADGALAQARSHAMDSTGTRSLTSTAAAALPGKVKKMTMAEFDALQGLAADPSVRPSLAVWVVTVHGAMSTDARPGTKATVQHVYTEVYDATTGMLLLQGIGVDALK